MDIGSKIKDARTISRLTQEQAAERLGVSRQTISSWENGKTYPDIVSVIKMSELYGVSLDRLLKGEEKSDMSNYLDYLEESTDTVRSRIRLSKLIMISVYLSIWTVSVVAFWLFVNGTGAAGYSIAVLYTALPITVFIISLLMGKNDFWGKPKWIAIPIFGAMHMLAEYVTFNMANMLLNSYSQGINMPNFGMLLLGSLVSAVGLSIGCAVRYLGKDSRKKVAATEIPKLL